ncbi:hypothetical protein J7M22_10275 [Candidatus Poribacteria bacterium]|nr:hypothetical protein [Candidatus Poribacteria bacterium]
MRGIRGSKETIGFLILTCFLSLSFIVSIVYATSASGWGSNNSNVYYSIAVWNLCYRPEYQYTSSEHSVYLNNTDPNNNINYEYTFSQTVDNNHYNTIEGNGTLAPGGGTLSEYAQVIVGVGDLPAGEYTIDAYTEVKFWDGAIDDYRVDAPTANFTKE